MTAVFLLCAVVGGTVLVFQLVLMFAGFAGEGVDAGVDGDLSDGLDIPNAADLPDLHLGGAEDAAMGHAETVSIFGVLSFRTIVAALTFFGLAGLAAQSAELSTLLTLLIALAAGLAAMYGVYWLMQAMQKLQSEGTARIERAVGLPATVYVPIPEHNSGTGKIQMNLQNRTMEYLAVTAGHRLGSGAKVVVTRVISSDTVEVEPALENEDIGHE